VRPVISRMAIVSTITQSNLAARLAGCLAAGQRHAKGKVVPIASLILEHPEWIAERLIRFANLVGRENVIATADCGFSLQALYRSEFHETVVWEKFKAMREGADLATRSLWGQG